MALATPSLAAEATASSLTWRRELKDIASKACLAQRFLADKMITLKPHAGTARAAIWHLVGQARVEAMDPFGQTSRSILLRGTARFSYLAREELNRDPEAVGISLQAIFQPWEEFLDGTIGFGNASISWSRIPGLKKLPWAWPMCAALVNSSNALFEHEGRLFWLCRHGVNTSLWDIRHLHADRAWSHSWGDGKIAMPTLADQFKATEGHEGIPLTLRQKNWKLTGNLPPGAKRIDANALLRSNPGAILWLGWVTATTENNLSNTAGNARN